MGLVRINNQLYKDINKDQELVDFFTKLTKFFKEEVKEEFKQRNIQLDISEPDFENLIIMARGLKDLGIETSLLSIDIVANKTNLYNSSSDKVKKIILDYDEIAFNDVPFRFDERSIIESFLQKANRHADFKLYWLNHQLEFIKNKSDLNKKIKEEKQKYERKKRMFGSLVSKNERLIELEIKEKELDVLCQKNNFYSNLTIEEMSKMLIMFDSILDVREQYSIYLHSHKIKEEILKEMKQLLFIRALGRLTQRESQKIDLEKIQIKLLKVLYLNHLNPEYLNNILFLAFDTDKLSFNVELVDWFVGAYEAELQELSDVAIENFDLLIGNESSKILSKKIY